MVVHQRDLRQPRRGPRHLRIDVGTGMNADSFTLQVGVPDAGSTLPLLGFASLGLVALRRKLRC